MKKILTTITLSLLLSIGSFAQCTVANGMGICAIVPGLVAQSFTSSCNGNLNSIEFFSSNIGTLNGVSLAIYNGNSPTGTPAYIEIFSNINVTTLNGPLTFNLTAPFQIVTGNQYVIEFNSGALMLLDGAAYVGGEAFLNTATTGFDFLFDITVSTPLAIDQHKIDNFNIFPSPTTGPLFISLEETYTGTLRVLNSLGQVIVEDDFEANKEFNISLDGPSGLYFLQLEIDGEIITKKVVKK